MTNLKCLKKLYTKLTGKNIADCKIDTTCEVLEMLANNITEGSGAIEVVSAKFTATSKDFEVTNANIHAYKCGGVYDISLAVNLSVATTTTNAIVTPIALTIPEQFHAHGCFASCALINTAGGGAKTGTLQLEAAIDGKSNINVYLNNAGVDAGDYLLVTTLHFIG